MKNKIVISTVVFLLILVNSCEVERPPRYFEVNGQRSKLNVALMNDWGTDLYDYSIRWWAISFRSETDLPSDFITFQLGSLFNETDIISEGVYEYDFAGGRGKFSDIAIGYDIRYDYKGQPSGYRLDDEIAEYSGTITVDKYGTTYTFIFDMEVIYNDQVYKITGEYEGRPLIDEYTVDLTTY